MSTQVQDRFRLDVTHRDKGAGPTPERVPNPGSRNRLTQAETSVTGDKAAKIIDVSKGQDRRSTSTSRNVVFLLGRFARGPASKGPRRKNAAYDQCGEAEKSVPGVLLNLGLPTISRRDFTQFVPIIQTAFVCSYRTPCRKLTRTAVVLRQQLSHGATTSDNPVRHCGD